MSQIEVVPGHTPGDVCTHTAGRRTLADMVEGRTRTSDAGRWVVEASVPDVRSCAPMHDGWIAAGGFTGHIVRCGPSGPVVIREGLAVPVAIDTSPEAVVVAEAGGRRIRFVARNAHDDVVVPLTAGNVSSVALDDEGAAWVPGRPNPVLWRVEPSGVVTRFDPPRRAKVGEFTGVTRHHSGKGLVLIDRASRRFWTFDTRRGFRPASRVTVGVERPRALRSHTHGPWRYSLADPPTGRILWLDETLQVRETWQAAELGRPFVMRVPVWGRHREMEVELRDAIVSPGPPGESRPHLILGGTPRDLRLLADGSMLVTQRSGHVVTRIDARLRSRCTYRANRLAYPCSADVNFANDEVWVLNPYRQEIVKFRSNGTLCGVNPLPTHYPRWLRIARNGSTLVIDAGRRVALVGHPGGWTELDLPPDLAPADIEAVEPTTGNAFHLATSTRKWAITDEGIHPSEAVG